MVDISSHMAKDFNETETLTAENIDKKKSYEITRVDEVEINSGPRAGSKAIVIELDKSWTYWPNKTSITNVANKLGTDTEKWIGKKIKLYTEKMMVRNQKRDVVFAESI